MKIFKNQNIFGVGLKKSKKCALKNGILSGTSIEIED